MVDMTFSREIPHQFKDLHNEVLIKFLYLLYDVVLDD